MFKSHGFVADSEVVCDNGVTLDLKTLPAFLRTLLVADGTVTKALEAYFWEPVMVERLAQQRRVLTAPVEGLPAREGDEVLCREVLLRGQKSGSDYAAARSFLWLDRLDPAYHRALQEGRIGIGELLREQGIETYREIIGLQYLESPPVDDELLALLQPPLMARSYRIRAAGEPAFLVTEYFPVSQYCSA